MLNYIQVVGCIKMWAVLTLNKKVLEIQRIDLFWSKSGTHTLFFFKIAMLLQLFNKLNVPISKLFTGLTN